MVDMTFDRVALRLLDDIRHGLGHRAADAMGHSLRRLGHGRAYAVRHGFHELTKIAWGHRRHCCEQTTPKMWLTAGERIQPLSP